MAIRLSTRAFFLVVVSLFLTASLFAADGRLTGRVTRQDGGPVGGVIVQIVGAPTATLTDPSGEYSLPGLTPGTYSVQFVAGDNVATEQNVVIQSGQTTRLDKQTDWQIRAADTITVYSASRRAERVVEAPAAVTVVSEQTIQNAAPTGQAPKVIENAPGVDFSQSGLYDINFNTRGFNSSLNRRVLTLIDGRDPSVPFLGAQEWAALSFPIDEFAGVELIRGPGSALYGANAFSGVLNMTTKSPRQSPGGRLIVTGGDLNTRRADIRQAGGFGNEWYYRVVGGYQHSNDFTRSRTRTTGVEYAGLPFEAEPLTLEEDEIKFGGLRIDKNFENGNVFTIEGGLAQLEGPTFQTGIGRVQVTDVDHPWGRINYNMRHFNFLGYYDARIAENQRALSSGIALWEDSHNLHGEVQTNWDFFGGRTRVIGGVAFNRQEVDTFNPETGQQSLMAEAQEEDQQSAFGQVEFDVTDRLKLVGAGRYDDSTLHEAQFSPKGAVVYEFIPNHSVRYGYNEAFQRPNYSELFLRAPAGAPVNLAAAAAGNPAAAPLVPALTALGFNSLPLLARGNANLDVEKVRSHEIGYQGIFGGKLYVTADYYEGRLSNFVTDLLPGVNSAFTPYVVPGTLPAPVQAGVRGFLQAALGTRFGGLTTVDGRPALVFSYANAGEVDTRGTELALNYYLTNKWVVDFNYSWFDFEVKQQQAGDQLLPNGPENKFNLGLGYRGDKLNANVSYRYVEEFPWAAGIFVGTVPQFDVVNAAASYRFTDRFGFGVDVSNLLDNKHYESFGGDILTRRALGYVTINW